MAWSNLGPLEAPCELLLWVKRFYREQRDDVDAAYYKEPELHQVCMHNLESTIGRSVSEIVKRKGQKDLVYLPGSSAAHRAYQDFLKLSHRRKRGLTTAPVGDLLSAQRAAQTLWSKLPLRAIAEAHKREAERLIAEGSVDDSTSNNAAICLEYYKYLQLFPDHLKKSGEHWIWNNRFSASLTQNEGPGSWEGAATRGFNR
ncbi:hypothetical protein B0H14DRAFT_2599873 [Mycena olivaceomarginata]|nr:hypothetical protein B0H14DRAFT_2599873 [Mycena olivaceomarginata]